MRILPRPGRFSTAARAAALAAAVCACALAPSCQKPARQAAASKPPLTVSYSAPPAAPYADIVATVFAQHFPHGNFAAEYEAAKAKNSDVVGWLFVPGATIDMAVTQTTDNDYYLHHGLDKQYKRKGNPFLDCSNTTPATSRNSILFGHNMGDGDLFGKLKKYQDAAYLANHPVVVFTSGTQVRYYKIFAVYLCAPVLNYIRTSFTSDGDFLGLIDECRRRSLFTTDVDVRASDHVLTFSTCTYEFKPKEGRFVVMARELRLDERESVWYNTPPAINPEKIAPLAGWTH